MPSDVGRPDSLSGFEAVAREVQSYDEESGEVEGDGDICRRPRLFQSAGQCLPRRHRALDSEWIEVSPKRWIGEFKSARAHRLPPGVALGDVAHREVVDLVTDEVVEDR